jgi:hypothetical protein
VAPSVTAALAPPRRSDLIRVGGWELLTTRSGAVTVRPRHHELQLRLGDAWATGTGRPGEPEELRSLMVVTMTEEGTVTASTRCSPPALVLADPGSRLLPADGARLGTTQVEVGDVLALCSAAALDPEPAGLVRLLCRADGWAHRLRLGDVLADLVDDVDGAVRGAAAVARYVGPPAGGEAGVSASAWPPLSVVP